MAVYGNSKTAIQWPSPFMHQYPNISSDERIKQHQISRELWCMQDILMSLKVYYFLLLPRESHFSQDTLGIKSRGASHVKQLGHKYSFFYLSVPRLIEETSIKSYGKERGRRKPGCIRVEGEPFNILAEGYQRSGGKGFKVIILSS